MKKLFTLCAAFAATIAAWAQPTTEALWQQRMKDAVASVEDAYRSAPVAVAADGCVYATGRFNQTITTENFFLEPVAQSSYLAKYDNNGAEQWAVALAGTATITAITLDENENVYIAGTLADQVVFNTTEGEAFTLEGEKEWGEYITDEVTGFIAKYNKDGKLMTAKTIIAGQHPEVDTQLSADANLMYIPESSTAFKINKLMAANGKIYASAIYAGNTVFEGATFESAIVNVWGFMLDDLKGAAVFSLSSENLTDATILADVKSAESITYDLATTVQSVNFTVGEDDVYVGVIGCGTLNFTTPNKTEKVELYLPGDGNVEYGHLIAKVGTTESLIKKYSAPVTMNSSKETIGGMALHNGTLYLAGTFNDTLAYNHQVLSTNKTDLYVAALDANSLEVNNTWVNGYDEEGSNENQEVFSSLLVTDNAVYLNGYNEVMDDHSINDYLTYTITDGTLAETDMETLVTGADAKGKYMAFATLNAQGITGVQVYENAIDAIENVEKQVQVQYNGNEILLSEPSHVEIFGMNGGLVARLRNAESVNVSALAKGCYIIRIQNAEGNTIFKFAK